MVLGVGSYLVLLDAGAFVAVAVAAWRVLIAVSCLLFVVRCVVFLDCNVVCCLLVDVVCCVVCVGVCCLECVVCVRCSLFAGCWLCAV